MGYFSRAVTYPSSSAGADLKEREQMSEVEVGVFVQRLRGLMNEIGEGPGIGERKAFRGPADPSPTHHPLLYKEKTVSVVSSVERQVTRVQRAFLSEGWLLSQFCPLTPTPPCHPSPCLQAWLPQRNQGSPSMLPGFPNCCFFCLEYHSLAT